MSNTQIQTILVSPGQTSGVINDVDSLTQVLIDLFRQYIPGLPPIRGLHNLGVSDQDCAPIPCIMVQPEDVTPSMKTTARFEKWYQFHIVWVIGGETPEEVAVLVTDGGALMQKLFSNNALNDRSASLPSNKYCGYPPYWIFSEMGGIHFEPAFLSGRTPGPKFFAFGEMHLRLQTVPALA